MRIGEHAIGRQVERGDRSLHPGRVVVADARNLHVGVLMASMQQIAHVHVIEVKADDFEFFHGGRGFLQERACTRWVARTSRP